MTIHDKYRVLQENLKALGSVAVAFSSGVDSTFLLKAAQEALGDKVIAVTASSCSFPKRELEEAKAFCEKNGICQIIVESEELDIDGFRQNPKNRCYLCKSLLFRSLIQAGKDAGYTFFCEGSNVDDTQVYRPGLQAVREAGVHSPLIDCHLTKAEIRLLAAEAGLSTASKPSTPCMATRLPYDTPFDYALLDRIHQGESWLRSLGFYNVRLRFHDPILRIEIDKADFNRFMDQHEAITKAMKDLGFVYITLDLEGYRTGSMNEVLV